MSPSLDVQAGDGEAGLVAELRAGGDRQAHPRLAGVAVPDEGAVPALLAVLPRLAGAGQLARLGDLSDGVGAAGAGAGRNGQVGTRVMV